MKKNLLPAVAVFVVVSLPLLWFSRDESLRMLQEGKYGDARTICMEDIRIAFERQWIIDWIDRGKQGSPLLFGLLPIPVEFTERQGKTPQILLRSLENGGRISIHLDAPNLPRGKLVANCSASSFCSLEKSRFGGDAEVMQVVAGPTTWITYLDQRIMVGVEKAAFKGITGVQISSCTARSARDAGR